MTNPRDDGEAVADLRKRLGEALRDAGCPVEFSPLLMATSQRLASLSRQLAEAQEARDLHAAALECYSKEQAIIRKELAEAQGVIERQRKALEAAEQWLSGWASAEPYISTIRAALSPPHAAAMGTSK